MQPFYFIYVLPVKNMEQRSGNFVAFLLFQEQKLNEHLWHFNIEHFGWSEKNNLPYHPNTSFYDNDRADQIHPKNKKT
jgi:hypothetical protein